MSSALEHETQALSTDLHALLRKVDPASFRDEFEADARAQLDRIVQRTRALLESAPTPDASTPEGETLRAPLGGILAAVERAFVAAPTATRAFWARFQREVHPAYEALVASLRSAHIVAPNLRPTNHARSIFHVCSSLFALGVITLAPSQGWIIAMAGAFFVYSWSMEIGRRIWPEMNARLMRFFGPVAHPHEHFRVNSATWYSTALLILAIMAKPAVSAVGVMVLGLADPAAALIGRRYGRIRLRAGRSLEGSLAFFAVAFVTAFVTLAALHPMGTSARVLCSLAAGLGGAVTELFSTRVDDNLSIPLATTAAVAIAASLLGASSL